jgi:hypothetical protein
MSPLFEAFEKEASPRMSCRLPATAGNGRSRVRGAHVQDS